MSKYRVITNGDKFRIEFRWLWGRILWRDYAYWHLVRVACPSDKLVKIAEFDSEEDAKNFIAYLLREGEIRLHKWKVV